jgi:hypothetical protein
VKVPVIKFPIIQISLDYCQLVRGKQLPGSEPDNRENVSQFLETARDLYPSPLQNVHIAVFHTHETNFHVHIKTRDKINVRYLKCGDDSNPNDRKLSPNFIIRDRNST